MDDLNEYDILQVSNPDSYFHKKVLQLIKKFGKPTHSETFDVAEHKAIKIARKKNRKAVLDEIEVVRNHLTSDQALIFSDEIKIFSNNTLFECVLVVFNYTCYLLHKDAGTCFYNPFSLLNDVGALVLST